MGGVLARHSGFRGPVEFRSANDGDNGDGRPLIALIIVELAAMSLLIAVSAGRSTGFRDVIDASAA